MNTEDRTTPSRPSPARRNWPPPEFMAAMRNRPAELPVVRVEILAIGEGHCYSEASFHFEADTDLTAFTEQASAEDVAHFALASAVDSKVLTFHRQDGLVISVVFRARCALGSFDPVRSVRDALLSPPAQLEFGLEATSVAALCDTRLNDWRAMVSLYQHHA